MDAFKSSSAGQAKYAGFRSFFNTYLFGKKGIFLVIIIFMLIQTAGLCVPEPLKTLDIGIKQAKEIAATLLASYISVLSIGLAISAIILAIVQIANRQITLTNLIFNRSYFIPLVYFGLLNIILLGMGQLMFRSADELFFEQVYIQIVIMSVYCFAFFLLLTFLVFYKTFAFLNSIYLIEEFLDDVYMEVELNNNAEYLSMRGREIYGEVTEAVKKDDNVLLNRFLQSIVKVFQMNSSSTFLFEIKDKIALWHKMAIDNEQDLMYETLLSFWRELRFLAIQNENIEVRNYFSKVPARTIETLETDLREPTFDYALRLKEMIVYSSWNDAKENPEELISYRYLRDLVFMVNLLLEKKDVPALEEIYNQFEQMVSLLSSDIEAARNPYKSPPPTEEDAQQALLQEQLRDRIFYTMLSIFSYYAYKKYYYTKEAFDDKLFGVLTKVLERYSYYYKPEAVRSVNIPEVLNWRDWVWALERRMDGKAYTIEDGETILNFGLLLLYLKFPFIRPSESNVSQQNVMEGMALQPAELLRTVTTLNLEELNGSIARVRVLFEGLNAQQQVDKEQRIRETAINPQKLKNFRDTMAAQWSGSRSLYPLFDYYRAVEVNPERKLQQVGTARMNLKDGRMMFIDGDDYGDIFGIDWGKQVNREIERLLAHRIDEVKESSIAAVSIIGALDDALSNFAEYDGLVALVPLRSAYRWQVDLINSGKYQNFEEFDNHFPFKALGIYESKIPVVSIDSSIAEGKTIVMKLPQAMKYQIRTNQDFVQNQLQVDILLLENKGTPEQNGAAPGDTDIPEENAVILVQEVMDFEVINKELIRIYHIT